MMNQENCFQGDRKRVLLGASWSIIEPLGLFFLSAVARQEGWEPMIVLAREPDFPELEKALREFNPDMLGFTVYIGNNQDVARFFRKARQSNPKLVTVVGGPHPTYFPRESTDYADYTVVSQGFNGFRQILRGEVEPGIIHPSRLEPFPSPDREQFYRDSRVHWKNPIKNIVTQTGCSYNCTYCYNSSTWQTIAGFLSPVQVAEMKQALPTGKLFPLAGRSVDDVIQETDEIMQLAPETRMIFFQDDIFGQDIEWLREFTDKWRNRLAFHVQMRFEFADPQKPVSRERLERLREAGCTGLTFAIESADPVIRREVLNRHMDNDLIFRTMAFAGTLGFKVRTEQILGLPRGATSKPTKVNLAADLEILEFNVRLREETGLPSIAWASTLAPYRGTRIEKYCIKHGFYRGNNSDITKDGYRIKSVLEFPRCWVGPGLGRDLKEVWLEPGELADYKEKLYKLMNLFSTFALIPRGERLAASFLRGDDQSFFGLGNTVRTHLYDYSLFGTGLPLPGKSLANHL